MRRTIQAPGIELRETDKSAYNKPDYSIVGTTTLACGFSSKGESYQIKWLNTLQDFEDTYGAPETEEEKFFYNAAAEVFTKGGIFFGAKIPYDNESKDKYTYTEYKLADSYIDVSEDSILSALNNVDPSIKKVIQINKFDSGTITLDEFDELKIQKDSLAQNIIKIVDITRTQYEKCKITKLDTDTYTASEIVETECLGIVPVIVTPINALFYQGLISSVTSAEYTEDTTEDPNESEHWSVTTEVQQYEKTTNIKYFQPLYDISPVGTTTSFDFYDSNYATPLNSTSINDNTISKTAVSYFPTIAYTDIQTIDTEYLKQIGIVVFQMYNANSSTSNAKITFRPVEAFVGSLNKNAKDATGASTFIDTIVNNSSQYINVISNCSRWKCYDKSSYKQLTLDNIDSFYIYNQVATDLGFTAEQCKKIISYPVMNTALNLIFEKAKDQNQYYIDLVVDAGISNIAQKYANQTTENARNSSLGLTNWPEILTVNSTKIWKSMLSKYNNFCQNLRKDCMFIADGFRGFCLSNDEKLVRSTSITSTVTNTIIPKLKYMSGINSSYSAGYCNWFLTTDAYSGEYIWLPPSIKMNGIYIYTDAYYNNWDAPAGMNRGKVTNAIDCAFSPNASESEKIYLQSWNYAVNYPLDGIVTEGQKTFQLKATAFDRVNVRRLFLYLEKEVSRIARRFLYEGNNEYQRMRFVESITPIFERAKNRNGILEYYIKCDEENNTAQVIDNNEMRCSIAVKPVKAIEFILLNFVCTNQSADVTEVLANS